MDYLQFSAETESSDDQLPNLAGVTSGGFMGMQDWGYTVGQLAGRSPIVLPTSNRKSWEIAAEAQRSRHHSYFIGFTYVLIGFVVLGIRRFRDFWSPIPEGTIDLFRLHPRQSVRSKARSRTPTNIPFRIRHTTKDASHA